MVEERRQELAKALGWKATCLVWMLHEGEAPPAATGVAAEDASCVRPSAPSSLCLAALTATLVGITAPPAGRDIDIKPYAISTLTSNQEVARGYQELDGNQVPERIEIGAAFTDSYPAGLVNTAAANAHTP